MTGIVFLLGFIISIYPATYIIEKWGIRVAVLLACLGSAAGAWIKVASIKSDRFWVLLLGQSVVALTQGLVTPLPATVAATWFGHQQVSTACSIGALGIQLGIAFGSFISPMIVDGTRDTEVIEEGLYTLALGVAILCSGIAVIAFIGFKKKPRTLPSHAQFALKQTSMSVKESILTLIKDFPFLMIVMGFSCNVGIFYALGTVLNQLVLTNHANGAIHVGRLGVLFVMTGMIGSAIFGYMLDKYHKFKTTTLVSFTVGFVALVAFSLCLNQEIEIMYVLTAVIGFFSAPSIPIGFQVVTEITYPVPPSISSGALLIASKVFGIVLTQMYSFILSNHNGILTNLLFPMVILIGILLVAFVRFELRRQTAEIGVVMPR